METKDPITIVVNGRYHAFDYAAELYRQGRLGRLISTMPVFEVIKRASRGLLRKEPPVVWYAHAFARAALRYVPRDARAIVGLGGYCLEIFQSPLFRNAVKIVDRSPGGVYAARGGGLSVG